MKHFHNKVSFEDYRTQTSTPRLAQQQPSQYMPWDQTVAHTVPAQQPRGQFANTHNLHSQFSRVNAPGDTIKSTNHGFLKQMFTLFAPLVILQPFIFCAQVAVQEMWMEKNWIVMAHMWLSELKSLPQLRILDESLERKQVNLYHYVPLLEHHKMHTVQHHSGMSTMKAILCQSSLYPPKPK